MPVPDTISSIKSKLRKKLTDLFIFFRFSGDIAAFHIPIFLSPVLFLLFHNGFYTLISI